LAAATTYLFACLPQALPWILLRQLPQILCEYQVKWRIANCVACMRVCSAGEFKYMYLGTIMQYLFYIYSIYPLL
jgi:hypothetical protein